MRGQLPPLWPNEERILRHLHTVGGRAPISSLSRVLDLPFNSVRKAVYWLRKKRLVFVLFSKDEIAFLTNRGYEVYRQFLKAEEEEFDDLPF